MATYNYLVSVITPDQVGLTRDIAQTVVNLEGYISDMRQTIVSGFFSLIFITEHTRDVGASLQDKLSEILPEGASLSIMPHPEQIKKALVKTSARYVVVCSGEDKSGIMLAISKFMAEHNINIEDWSTIFDKKHVTHLAYVTFRSPCIDLKDVQESFKRTMADLNFKAQMCHEDIFRATSEVAPIKSLVQE